MSNRLASLRQQIEAREQAILRDRQNLARHRHALQQCSRDRLASPTGIAIAFLCGLASGLLKDRDTLKHFETLRSPGGMRIDPVPLLASLFQNLLLDRIATPPKPGRHRSEKERSTAGRSPANPPEDGAKARGLSQWIITLSTGGIFVLLLCYTLYSLAGFLIPISLAVLFSFLFKPVIRKLGRMHVPQAGGAALSILFLLGIMTAGVYTLSQPAEEWMKKSPVIAREFASKLQTFSESLEDIDGDLQGIGALIKDIQRTTKRFERLTAPKEGAESEPIAVQIDRPGLPMRLLVETPSILMSIGIFFIMLYFLLLGSDTLLVRLVQVLPDFHGKRQAVRIIFDIQNDTSQYLLTMLIINIGLGTAGTVALYLLGIPNAVLWGVMIGALNFAPYLGPLISISILTLVAILTLDTFIDALFVTLTLTALQVLEGQFITPHIMGRRFALSPTLIFLSILFWGGLWGVVGVLMAVPLLVAFKVICENIESLNPIARLIER